MQIPSTMWENIMWNHWLISVLGGRIFFSKFLREKEYEEYTLRVYASQYKPPGHWGLIQLISGPLSLLWPEKVTVAFKHNHLHPISLYTQDESERMKIYVCHLTSYRLWNRFPIWKIDTLGCQPQGTVVCWHHQRSWLFSSIHSLMLILGWCE